MSMISKHRTAVATVVCVACACTAVQSHHLCLDAQQTFRPTFCNGYIPEPVHEAGFNRM
jgi:hypothetical protein